MDWTIVAGRPVYLQLIEQLELAIITGEYPPGEKIPGVRDLAAQAQVNPNTMQRALAELEARGLLETQRTAGRTVTSDTEKLAQAQQSLARKLVHDFYRQAAALGLTKAELAALLEQEERARIAGLVINKFRGDVEILRPGLAMLEEKTGLPVLGVVPYLHVEIEDEDSLSERLNANRAVKPLDAAVIRLPHISNFTDFMPLEQHELLGVRYVQRARELGRPDLVILPGTKNTMEDLLWLRQNGLEAAALKLAHAGTPILGVCGGYQMLGQTLDDPQGTESGRPMALSGLGLLPTRTVFDAQKRRMQVRAAAQGELFGGARLTGYEIHNGRTEVGGAPFCMLEDGTPEGCVNQNVFGTYLHGLFDSGELTGALVRMLCARKGISPTQTQLMSMADYRQQQFDLLADGVRQALDMGAVYRAINMA